MFETLLIITGVIIVGAAFYAHLTTKDPMHPMVVFAPMLLYVYVFHPYTLNYQGGLDDLFSRPNQLSTVLLVHLVGISGFCLGLVSIKLPRLMEDRRLRVLDRDVAPGVRRNIVFLAFITGIVAMIGFWFLVWYSGGPVRLMSRGKPFLRSPTGYLGELPMLTYPALLLLAVGWQGMRLTAKRGLGALFIASPQLAWVIIGKRRGPLFLISVCLATFFFMVTGRKPSWRSVMFGLAFLGFGMLFLLTNRRHLGMTSEEGVDLSAVASMALGETVSTGDDYVAGAGYILACDYNRHHFWGLRYFQTYFIRPIPKQIWPTKYEDFGLQELVKNPGLAGMTTSQWVEAIGWSPTKGSSGGFVSDSFVEFSWGCIVLCGVVGWMYAVVWKNSIARGGIWTVVYAELLILSIYLPTQSIGAWSYRLLLFLVPSILIWRFVVRKDARVGFAASAPQLPPPPSRGGPRRRDRRQISARRQLESLDDAPANDS